MGVTLNARSAILDPRTGSTYVILRIKLGLRVERLGGIANAASEQIAVCKERHSIKLNNIFLISPLSTG
jgi:hypothetical protein